jgi:hypothetical protein
MVPMMLKPKEEAALGVSLKRKPNTRLAQKILPHHKFLSLEAANPNKKNKGSRSASESGRFGIQKQSPGQIELGQAFILSGNRQRGGRDFVQAAQTGGAMDLADGNTPLHQKTAILLRAAEQIIQR